MNFDKRGFEEFRRDFKTAMADLEEKHDVFISIGNIRYDETSFGSKLSVTSKPTDGKSQQQSEFERLAESFGVKKSDYGKTIRLQDGTDGKLVGIKERGRKYPFVVKISDGRRYKMGRHSVITQLAQLS